MNQEGRADKVGQPANFGSTELYIIGFILSLALTMAAYLTVKHHVATHHAFPTDRVMLAILAILAISQLVVQLVCFLHLDKEAKPRWNLLVLAFAVLVVVIIVAGSLWIMYHLNYNMTSRQMNTYLKQQDGGI